VERSCGHGNEPLDSKNVEKFLRSCANGGFSRRAELHAVITLSEYFCYCLYITLTTTCIIL
jgi:hypothetical protein